MVVGGTLHFAHWCGTFWDIGTHWDIGTLGTRKIGITLLIETFELSLQTKSA